MRVAWTSPPKKIRAACSSAPRTEVGRVTVTSMIATVWVPTSPATGPIAQAIPARKVQPARSRTKATRWAAAR